MRAIRQFLRISEGATAVEYAVLLAMIIMAAITSIGTVGTQTGNLWSAIRNGMQTAGVGS